MIVSFTCSVCCIFPPPFSLYYNKHTDLKNLQWILPNRRVSRCSRNSGCCGVCLRCFTLCRTPCMPSVILWWTCGALLPASSVQDPSSSSSQHWYRCVLCHMTLCPPFWTFLSPPSPTPFQVTILSQP